MTSHQRAAALPKRRRSKRRRLLASAIAVSAMACGLYSPVQASDTGDEASLLSQFSVPIGPNEGSAGPRVTVPSLLGRPLRLGPVASPIPGDRSRAWCVQLELTRPDVGISVVTRSLGGAGSSPYPELALTVPEAAWLLDAYGHGSDAWTNAAIASLMHANFEQDSAGIHREDSIREVVEAIQVYEGGVIYTTARQLVVQARAHASVQPGTLHVTSDNLVTTLSGQHARSGEVSNIGAVSADGEWMTGINLEVTLEGPAVFDETGSSVWNGTSESSPRSLAWTATGYGEVTVSSTLAGLSSESLTMYEAGGQAQNTLVYPSGQTRDIPGSRERFGVAKDFQPLLTSNVGESKVVDKGGPLTDTLTVAADPSYKNPEWMMAGGEPVPVTFEGTAYFSGEAMPVESAGPPPEAEVIGHATVVAQGPGVYQASVEGIDRSGYVTWVWDMKKDTQGDYSLLVAGDWHDGYGLAPETASVRYEIAVDTAAFVRDTKSGMYLVDDVFVTGFPANHPQFTGGSGFGPDRSTLTQSLYFFAEGMDVTDDDLGSAVLIGSTTLPARNGYHPSVGSTDFLIGSDPARGTYVFVTEFEGDDRVRPYRSSVTDRSEQFVVGPETPHLTTTLTGPEEGKVIVPDGPVLLTDTVCYDGVVPAKEYLLTGTLMDKVTGEAIMLDGKPVVSTVPLTPTEASGCADVVFTVDSAHLAGRSTVAFEQLSDDGVVIAVHTDINDAGQTVRFSEETPPSVPPETSGELPKTGASPLGIAAASLGLLAAGLVIKSLVRRKSVR